MGCGCGRIYCACYNKGYRDGFGAGYRVGYVDGKLGNAPLFPVPSYTPPISLTCFTCYQAYTGTHICRTRNCISCGQSYSGVHTCLPKINAYNFR